MSLAEIIQQWPTIVTGLTGLGGGGIFVKVLEHQRAKRTQSDNVALDLVKQLSADMAAMRANYEARIERIETAATHERDICEARLSTARHELRNVAANLDGLLLALKYADPDKIREIAADVLARRHAAIQPIPAELPVAA